MIKRRAFVGLCGVLAVNFLAWGHTRKKPSGSTGPISEFVGPRQPVAENPIKDKALSVTARDVHPDEFVIENIALPKAGSVTQASAEIILSGDQKKVFEMVLARLARLQDYVGYGNFNIIDWDQSLRTAARREQIGAFTKPELEFIESIFFFDARSFGFYGDKVVTRLTASISKKDIQKIPRSGHYLFKGDAADTYRKIRRDIGDSIVLTSGIRNVVKQIYLFLNKAARVDGNLSLASYSIAPPGHSYHAIGDFDVGKKSFGRKNFTEEFARTDEFKRLSDFGYLDIRYPQNNPYGVRYEPWHIKVV